MTKSRMYTVLLCTITSDELVAEPIEEINALDRQIDDVWLRYSTNDDYAANKTQAEEFWSLWREFQQARGITLTCAANGDFDGARKNVVSNGGPKFKLARQALQSIINSNDHS